MALRWQWDEKIGEAIIRQTINGKAEEFTKTLYEGNAFLIFLTEWKDEEDNGMYAMYTFFADEKHAKICLGLDKKREYTGNILDCDGTKLVKVRINKKKSNNWKKIITLLAQAFDNIDIEIYTEE